MYAASVCVRVCVCALQTFCLSTGENIMRVLCLVLFFANVCLEKLWANFALKRRSFRTCLSFRSGLFFINYKLNTFEHAWTWLILKYLAYFRLLLQSFGNVNVIAAVISQYAQSRLHFSIWANKINFNFFCPKKRKEMEKKKLASQTLRVWHFRQTPLPSLLLPMLGQ